MKKEPGLLRQIIAIHHEQALRRKALRTLVKQEWSVDFLIALIRKAADIKKDKIELEIVNKEGVHLLISSVSPMNERLDDSDDIFNHLDDDAAVARFIREHAARR